MMIRNSIFAIASIVLTMTAADALAKKTKDGDVMVQTSVKSKEKANVRSTFGFRFEKQNEKKGKDDIFKRGYNGPRGPISFF